MFQVLHQLLGGVAAVGREVDQVVEEIGSGRDRAHGEEAEHAGDPRLRLVVGVPHEHGHEQQDVLGPLMDPEGLAPVLEPDGGVREARLDRPVQVPAQHALAV